MNTPNEYNYAIKTPNDKIHLHTGSVNKIHLRPLGDNPAIPITAVIFAFDSSFPTPGVFSHLALVQEMLKSKPDSFLMVFGHTDKMGTNEYNKLLSERRAMAIISLLTHDIETFKMIADAENWDLRVYQSMLRGINCNPGAIDGIDGPMTSAAIKSFQYEYNEGLYHDNKKKLAVEGLSVDGILTDNTKAAIRDAYLAVAPVNVPKNRLAPKSFAGCSEFNPISNIAEPNRRVVIAFIGQDSPLLTDIPCCNGKISACRLDNKGNMRCNFYRRGIQEDTKDQKLPRFFDFQWLKEKSGEAHLSALTYLPDGTSVKFTIYKYDQPLPVSPAHSTMGVTRPSIGNQLGTVDGTISGGVCYARWKPPKDYDPFDFNCWLIELDLEVEIFTKEDEAMLDDSDPGSSTSLFNNDQIEPPVFCIDAGGHWGFSNPPGKQSGRIRFVNISHASGIALRSDGGIVNFTVRKGRIDGDGTIPILSLVLSEKEHDNEETIG